MKDRDWKRFQDELTACLNGALRENAPHGVEDAMIGACLKRGLRWNPVNDNAIVIYDPTDAPCSRLMVMRIVNPDGSSPHIDGDPGRIVLAVHDVSDRPEIAEGLIGRRGGGRR